MADFQLHTHEGHSLEPEEWDRFIKASPQGCIYALHGYLTCIRADWKAYVVEEKGKWIAIMPFILNQKGPFTFLPQGPLTQYWGIFFEEIKASLYQRQSKEAKIIELIGEAISPIHLHTFNLAPNFPYVLPFHWLGYDLRPRFSFQLNLTKGLDQLQAEIASSHKRQIRKSEKSGHQLEEAESFEVFEGLFQKNLEKGHDLSAGDKRILPLLKEVYAYLRNSQQGKLKVLKDPTGTPLAAALFAHACGKMYYLSGAYHPDFMSSGAMTRLLWEGIKEGESRKLTVFDFEGSMIPGIAQFFRKFGAEPISYFQLYKNNLPLWAKWLQKLKS